MMKYGLLKTGSYNIGDEIQCIASKRFLPHIDYYVNREYTDKFVSNNNEKVKLIMNHWWLHQNKHFPPSKCLVPLYVSFHLKYPLRTAEFLKKDVKEHFKKYEPIGCRDTGTASFLKKNGIDAYFSGCLTTTLLPNQSLKNKFISDYILCVDVPDKILKEIRKRTNKRVVVISRHQQICLSREQRMKLAYFTLFLYHNAACVITIALHAAILSTAFQTPVCVIDNGDYERSTRFEGLEKLFNNVRIDDFIKHPEVYDINNPPSNPSTYVAIRDKLVKRCKDFTGYDSNQPTLGDDYNPILDIAEIMPFDKKNTRNAVMYLEKKDVIKSFVDRIILRKQRYDFI